MMRKTAAIDKKNFVIEPKIMKETSDWTKNDKNKLAVEPKIIQKILAIKPKMTRTKPAFGPKMIKTSNWT